MTFTTPTSASGGGLKRATLRQATAAAPAEAAPRLPAQRPAAAAPAESSDFVYFLKALGWMSAGVIGLLALTAAGMLMADNMAASNALTEAKRQRGTLVCQDGHMQHGDGSLHDRVFADGYFVCDDWKTLEAIKEEEMKLANPPKMQATQIN